MGLGIIGVEMNDKSVLCGLFVAVLVLAASTGYMHLELREASKAASGARAMSAVALAVSLEGCPLPQSFKVPKQPPIIDMEDFSIGEAYGYY